MDVITSERQHCLLQCRGMEEGVRVNTQVKVRIRVRLESRGQGVPFPRIAAESDQVELHPGGSECRLQLAKHTMRIVSF
jgi:hypothetical protein